MAAKHSQEEMSSMNDEEDVSLQVRAELSEKNKASVTEDNATGGYDLHCKDQEEKTSENQGRHSDDMENGENIPPAHGQYLENGNEITDDEWEKLENLTSVQACLEFYDKNNVKLAVLKLVREKGYFPADTKAADIVEHISDGM